MKEKFYLKEYAKYLADMLLHNNTEGSVYYQLIKFYENGHSDLIYRTDTIEQKIEMLEIHSKSIQYNFNIYVKTFNEFNTEINTKINRNKKLKQLIK